MLSVLILPTPALSHYGGDSCACVLCVCKADGVWLLLAKLTAPDGIADDRLGYAVSMTGNGTRVAAGASWDDDTGYNSGSVYIFAEEGVYL